MSVYQFSCFQLKEIEKSHQKPTEIDFLGFSLFFSTYLRYNKVVKFLISFQTFEIFGVLICQFFFITVHTGYLRDFFFTWDEFPGFQNNKFHIN